MAPTDTPTACSPEGHTLADDEVIARAMNAANGDLFSRLWRGETGNESRSEADLALCRLLVFWVGPDLERVRSLFALSALGNRPKWSRESYWRPTVERALKDQKTYFVHQLIQVNPVYSNYYTLPTEGGQATILSPQELERGMGMGRELAEQLKGQPEWRASFDLARCLRTLVDNTPEQFKPVVIEFCRLTERPFDHFFLEFLLVWEKVRSGDTLALALSLSESQPYVPVPCFTPLYQTVASLAYHLSQLNENGVFFLPRPKLARSFKIYPVAISRAVQLLELRGLIKCVSHEYRFRKGPDGKPKAKEYVWTGPPQRIPEPSIN